jgi:hypothetical protein
MLSRITKHKNSLSKKPTYTLSSWIGCSMSFVLVLHGACLGGFTPVFLILISLDFGFTKSSLELCSCWAALLIGILRTTRRRCVDGCEACSSAGPCSSSSEKIVRKQKNSLIKNSQNAHWLGKKEHEKICYNSPERCWLATSEPTKPGGLGGCIGGGSIHTTENLQWKY